VLETKIAAYAGAVPVSRKRRKDHGGGRARRGRGGAPGYRGGSSRTPTATLELPPIAFPADLLGLSAPEHTEIGVDIVMRRNERVPLDRVSLRLLRRIVGPTHAELWGRDRDGVFDVHLRAVESGTWQLKAHVASTELDGHRMLIALSILDAFRAARAIGLAPPGGVPSTWSEPVRGWLEEPPPRLREVVEAHAEIERRLGLSVRVPESYTKAEVRDTLETAALLRGETVSGTWRRREWSMPAPDASRMVDGVFADDGQAMIELEESWFWIVGGAEVKVGEVAVVHRSARLLEVEGGGGPTAEEGDETTLVLAPGADKRITHRLVEVTPIKRTARSDTHNGVADSDEGIGGARPASREGDQRWFWAPSWQSAEAEVDELVADGQIETHDDVDAMFDHLEATVNRRGPKDEGQPG
jgi:hypothetical protein